MGLDQWMKAIYNDGQELEFYYRKENWLRGWLIENTELEENSNYVVIEVDIDKLKDLHDTCSKVLEQKDENTSDEELPTHDGFFFGFYDYDDCYYGGIMNVKENIEQILENEDKISEVLYWDWW